MDETRESSIAALLARGLVRFRRSAERSGPLAKQADDESPKTTAAEPDAPTAPAARRVVDNRQGEQP